MNVKNRSDAAVRGRRFLRWAVRIDGYQDCAELFGRLADQERRAIEDLKGCLRNHIADL